MLAIERPTEGIIRFNGFNDKAQGLSLDTNTLSARGNALAKKLHRQRLEQGDDFRLNGNDYYAEQEKIALRVHDFQRAGRDAILRWPDKEKFNLAAQRLLYLSKEKIPQRSAQIAQELNFIIKSMQTTEAFEAGRQLAQLLNFDDSARVKRGDYRRILRAAKNIIDDHMQNTREDEKAFDNFANLLYLSYGFFQYANIKAREDLKLLKSSMLSSLKQKNFKRATQKLVEDVNTHIAKQEFTEPIKLKFIEKAPA